MDYQPIVNLVVQAMENALPIGIIFLLAERVINFFLTMAFPKTFKGGI